MRKLLLTGVLTIGLLPTSYAINEYNCAREGRIYTSTCTLDQWDQHCKKARTRYQECRNIQDIRTEARRDAEAEWKRDKLAEDIEDGDINRHGHEGLFNSIVNGLNQWFQL